LKRNDIYIYIKIDFLTEKEFARLNYIAAPIKGITLKEIQQYISKSKMWIGGCI
jgi:hypothetical protein